MKKGSSKQIDVSLNVLIETEINHPLMFYSCYWNISDGQPMTLLRRYDGLLQTMVTQRSIT